MNQELKKFCREVVDELNLISKKFHQISDLPARHSGLITKVETEPSITLKECQQICEAIHQSFSHTNYQSWLASNKTTKDILEKLCLDQVPADQDKEKRTLITELVLILSDIKSTHNIGSFFRIADCFGAKEIFLTGYTAGIESDKIAKSAMGCDQWIPYSRNPSSSEVVEELKKQGYQVIGAELSSQAQSITEHSFQKKTAIVFGNERTGIDTFLQDRLDHLVQIPMLGKKLSLNVSCSAGVFCQKYIEYYLKD